jgi:hypothetical protein
MNKKLADLRCDILAAWYAGDAPRYLALIAQHNRIVKEGKQ